MEEPEEATQATQEAPLHVSQNIAKQVVNNENVFMKLVMTRMLDGKTEVIPLTTDVHNGFWGFGRHKSCEVVLNGPRVSNFHFEIYQGHRNDSDESENVVFLHDHSSNGTFLNFERLAKNSRTILSNGDEIRIGLGVPKDEISFLCQVPVKHSRDSQKNMIKSENSHYEIIRTLGSGTFAVVKLAVEVNSGKWYAIKIINKRKILLTSSEKRATEMFQREIDILKSLHHPGVVQCHEICENDDELFIVMEYVEGGDLMDFLIANGSIDEQDCKPLLKQLLETLLHLHKQGVTHRDIKPENILITNDFHLKISDFGLAKVIHGTGTFLETFCGTMGYLAPEVLKSKNVNLDGGYDDKVDIWSLGCVLYVMLTASIPFASSSQAKCIELISKGAYPIEPLLENEISEEGIDLINRMLEINPEKRISESEALQHPWFYTVSTHEHRTPPSSSEHEATEQLNSSS
nr:serine /threonine protein kinase [Schizosaccharomyces pombe]prf//2110385A protein kinase cds1 [Schizosaccharomyces pombe]